MKVIITVSEAQDMGIWAKLCKVMGIDVYATNEGKMDGDDEISLTEEELKQIGLKMMLVQDGLE